MALRPYQGRMPLKFRPYPSASLTSSVYKVGKKSHQLQVARWWQLKYFFMFTPKIGEDGTHFEERAYFSDGLVETTNQVGLVG